MAETRHAHDSTLHRVAVGVEEQAALDRPVDMAERLLPSSIGPDGSLRPLLGGQWLGHALHPMLTDFPLGAWMSASLLDFVGGKQARPASRRLIAFGILAAVPTAVAGASDWLSSTHRQQRVGVVHAVTNSTALGLYAGSWLARRRGRQAQGVLLGVVGGLAATVGGFFGGHLSMATDAGLRATESAFEADD
ncbi:MAG: DUF2231 domain-containing protein [Actinobacteria bacterium]|nr:DUF2231 domain-containing protein [Actinomycetota bacterium]